MGERAERAVTAHVERAPSERARFVSTRFAQLFRPFLHLFLVCHAKLATTAANSTGSTGLETCI
jgi:hypothetical protein